MTHLAPAIGERLREWRQRRRLSQLDLAGEAEISTRHLSFLETGRASPSRDMVLRLAERLEVPIRDRNVLLVAAGYAPVFSERAFDDPALKPARAAIDLILQSQRPYPAFALDRHWRIVATNDALPQIYEGVAPDLLEAPVNAIRLSLHPRGLARRIANLAEWAAHLLHRLGHQIELTADPELIALRAEVAAYVGHLPTAGRSRNLGRGEVLVPLRLRTDAGELSLFSTTLVFGTPVEVTLSELAIESFFPADAETAERVRRLTSASQQSASLSPR